MAELTERNDSHRPRHTLLTVLVVASLALSVYAIAKVKSLPTATPGTAQHEDSTLDRINHDKVLNVGWGGFPPYTQLDPSATNDASQVVGFAVDLVEEIARRHEPPLSVKWHLFQWETFRADLANKKFDFIADPVFQTVGRASDFKMSTPYSYFGIAVAIVRKGDRRFVDFSDLDNPDVTIALAEGYTSSEFARQHLTKPKMKSIPVGQTAFVQLDEVLMGRADAALNDVPTVAQYARAHSNEVEAIWLDNPPSRVPGGFICRTEDADLVDFLNTSIQVLQVDGVVATLDAKWKTLGYFEERHFTPGKGLSP